MVGGDPWITGGLVLLAVVWEDCGLVCGVWWFCWLDDFAGCFRFVCLV